MSERETYIYFVAPVSGDGPVKIGCSYWPKQRLKDIMVWSPVPLTILATCKGDIALERFLHRKFKANRSHREWFHLTQELIDAIERIALGHDPLDVFDVEVARHKQALYPVYLPRGVAA